MTCQHCQTWILDDDHRCQRCGRRVRSTPSRISPATYPIAATATARAYESELASDFKREAHDAGTPALAEPGQQPLFKATVSDSRVIPFSSLMSEADRDALRLRAAQTERPVPAKTARVESRRVRAKRSASVDQHELGFPSPQSERDNPSSQICNAPVAPAAIRMQAALLDSAIMAAGCAIGAGLFLYVDGHLTTDKHLLPFLLGALFTVPLLYKLLWAFAGQDTIGTQMAGLELVDFDGKQPTKARRFQRLFGSILSFLAAGIGMVWALVDEDKLTWHDHMSGTFPTFLSEV